MPESLLPESEGVTRYVVNVFAVTDVVKHEQDYRVLEKKADGSEPRGYVTTTKREKVERLIFKAETDTKPNVAALVAAMGEG